MSPDEKTQRQAGRTAEVNERRRAHGRQGRERASRTRRFGTPYTHTSKETANKHQNTRENDNESSDNQREQRTRRGLVAKEHQRLGHELDADRHALLLPARQLKKRGHPTQQVDKKRMSRLEQDAAMQAAQNRGSLQSGTENAV